MTARSLGKFSMISELLSPAHLLCIVLYRAMPVPPTKERKNKEKRRLHHEGAEAAVARKKERREHEAQKEVEKAAVRARLSAVVGALGLPESDAERVLPHLKVGDMPAALPSLIDHTLLKADSTRDKIRQLCAEVCLLPPAFCPCPPALPVPWLTTKGRTRASKRNTLVRGSRGSPRHQQVLEPGVRQQGQGQGQGAGVEAESAGSAGSKARCTQQELGASIGSAQG